MVHSPIILANSPPGNPVRSIDDSLNLPELLKGHYDPAAAAKKIRESEDFWARAIKKDLTSTERKEKGWDQAYDLRPWHEFPDSERANVLGVVLQNVTRGTFGSGGGPTAESTDLGAKIRKAIFKHAAA